MNINMKYYIVTIGSIFLALGIGIIVGFNLNYDEQLSRQQSEVLEEFESRFDVLNEEKDELQQTIDSLKENNNKLQSYISSNYNILVADVLTDKNIGIILTNDKNDYSEDIQQIILDSNGNLAFNIVISDNIENVDKLAELSKQLGKEITTPQDAINYIFDTLATEEAKSVDIKSQLDSLAALELIEIKYFNENYTTYDSVVLVGENEDENMANSFETKDANIIAKLKEDKKYLVAVQREQSKSEFINLCSDLKISTINNIDDETGKISLTMLIKDKSKVGNFGIGEEVDNLMPFSK